MTPGEHYERAQQLMATAEQQPTGDGQTRTVLKAQVHATLATCVSAGRPITEQSAPAMPVPKGIGAEGWCIFPGRPHQWIETPTMDDPRLETCCACGVDNADD